MRKYEKCKREEIGMRNERGIGAGFTPRARGRSDDGAAVHYHAWVYAARSRAFPGCARGRDKKPCLRCALAGVPVRRVEDAPQLELTPRARGRSGFPLSRE